MNTNNEIIAINVKEAITNSTPVLVFDGSSPINVEDARAHYQKKVEFHLGRINRATQRPTPNLYNEKGELSKDMHRFHDDMDALLHAQKCRAAIETVMTTSETVNLMSIKTGHTTSFKKISDDSLLITDC